MAAMYLQEFPIVVCTQQSIRAALTVSPPSLFISEALWAGLLDDATVQHPEAPGQAHVLASSITCRAAAVD